MGVSINYCCSQCLASVVSCPAHQQQHFLHCHGSHQADCQEVHWRQGSQEAAGHQGCQEVCPCHWGCQEATPLQAWHCCSQGDQEVPEIHRAPDPQAPIPTPRGGNRPGFQD